MPQLDTLTFFSQFFWLSFFFLGFYAILVKYYLPKMSRILKIRSRKIATSPLNDSKENFEILNPSQIENCTVLEQRDVLLSNGINYSLHCFQEKTSASSQWLDATVYNTNKNQLNVMNTKYLSNLADSHIQTIFLFHHLKSVLSPNSFKEAGILNIFKKVKNSSVISAKEKLFSYRVFEHLIK